MNENHAFPVMDQDSTYWQPGLTKREYIAAMAMQGLLSNPEVIKNDPGENVIASLALSNADALLDMVETKTVEQ